MKALVAWYVRERALLTAHDVERIRGAWLSIPLTEPFLRWLILALVERFW